MSMPFERSDQTDNGSAQPETVATLLRQWACATRQAFKRQMLCGPRSTGENVTDRRVRNTAEMWPSYSCDTSDTKTPQGNP